MGDLANRRLPLLRLAARHAAVLRSLHGLVSPKFDDNIQRAVVRIEETHELRGARVVGCELVSEALGIKLEESRHRRVAENELIFSELPSNVWTALACIESGSAGKAA